VSNLPPWHLASNHLGCPSTFVAPATSSQARSFATSVLYLAIHYQPNTKSKIVLFVAATADKGEAKVKLNSLILRILFDTFALFWKNLNKTPLSFTYFVFSDSKSIVEGGFCDYLSS
jgi:hypothetical protein